jgi:hypothetical protein
MKNFCPPMRRLVEQKLSFDLALRYWFADWTHSGLSGALT